MSESVSESPPRSSGGSVFTRKIGPLPMWSWMAIFLVLGLVYYFYKKSKSAATSATPSTDGTTVPQSASGTLSSPDQGTDSSLIPQFVNQVYNTPTPPAAPNVTVNNTTTTTPAPVAQANQYPAPTGTTAKKLSSTSAQVQWNYITSITPTPKSYTVAVYNSAGKLVSQQTVNPDTKTNKGLLTVQGLPANAKGLKVSVWANGGKVAPPGGETTVTL